MGAPPRYNGLLGTVGTSCPSRLSRVERHGVLDSFRAELSWPKLFSAVLLLTPVPARLKEWADAGFAITLGSALIAHLSVGDGPENWGWAAGTGVLWGLSYYFWRSLQGG